MIDACPKSFGSVVAEMLKGSWRLVPPSFEHSAAELEGVVPLILNSGAAALCWRRVQRCDLRTTEGANELRRVYHWNSLQTVFQQERIEATVKLMRVAGIEPILVKGWAAVQLYPEAGVRPCGDIDLCVSPHQFALAERKLSDLPETRHHVDLHCGFAKFGGGSFDEIYDRARLIKVRGTNVPVPCAEDHLRIISIHMLREGAWRPIWLCDVAAALESRPMNFDWDRCWGKKKSNWVMCALRLAHELLGADLTGTPATKGNKSLPQWVVPAVLKEWGTFEPSMAQRHHARMVSCLRFPSRLFAGFRQRWPNPIEATIIGRGRFNDRPRLPLQVSTYVGRGAKFLARLPRLLREQ